jgi:hypothetical protein
VAKTGAAAPPAIFLSYRRDDASGHAGRLADRLRARFGKDAVFMDVLGSIEPGVPFPEAIERAVGSSDVLLTVIGRQWVKDSSGRRRLDDTGDFVRFEVAGALKRKIRVIPVLVDRAAMPRAEDLPEDVRSLASHQAVELSESRWDFDVSQLISTLEKLLKRPETPRVPGWARALTAGVALVSIAIVVWMLRQSPVPEPETVRPENPTTAPTPAANPVPDRTKPDNPVPDSAQAPEPPTPANGQLVTVPDVRSMQLEAARRRLSESGLVAGSLTHYTLPGRPPGTVYSQDTAAGTRVRVGSPIGLYVVREREQGIQSSGLVSLSDSEVWDLDGTERNGREGLDIRFDNSTRGGPQLQAQDGAMLSAAGRSPPTRERCAAANFSSSPVALQVGIYLCARTDEGRYALLGVDDLGTELRLRFDTWESGNAAGGPAGGGEPRTVRLSNRNSFDFSTSSRGTLEGGDLYVTIAANGAAQFFANNRGQRGLVDLGDIRGRPLTSVRPPQDGYYKFGVPAVEEHTYVSLAGDGEEGHHVVFRVTRITDTFVALSYIYR